MGVHGILLCIMDEFTNSQSFNLTPLPPTYPYMYKRDCDGYYNIIIPRNTKDINSTRTLVLTLSTLIIPFFTKHFIYPVFSGFFAVFSDHLRNLTLSRFRRRH